MEINARAVADEGSCEYGAGLDQGEVINPMPVVHAAPMRAFACNYCSRIFVTSRALGSHQIAQKREESRTLAEAAADLNQDCNLSNCHGKSYPRKQQSCIYHSDLPSAEKIIPKAKANYTGMWPSDGSSSSGSHQLSYQSSFVPNLDLDLHL